MKQMLEEYGYVQWGHENEWHKENWTVRFSFLEVEAFDDPLINTQGNYYKCNLLDANLKDILDDIELFLK